MLIVISILGMLTVIITPNFMALREKARDTKRKSDLRQISTAIELYRQNQNPPAYPTALPTPGQCWTSVGPESVCTEGAIVYIKKMPADPNLKTQDGKSIGYFYKPSLDGQSYKLCGCLENIGDSEALEADCDDSYPCLTTKRAYIVTEP